MGIKRTDSTSGASFPQPVRERIFLVKRKDVEAANKVRVVVGDTLSGISVREGVSMARLRELNPELFGEKRQKAILQGEPATLRRGPGDLIFPGDEVVVRGPGDSVNKGATDWAPGKNANGASKKTVVVAEPLPKKTSSTHKMTDGEAAGEPLTPPKTLPKPPLETKPVEIPPQVPEDTFDIPPDEEPPPFEPEPLPPPEDELPPELPEDSPPLGEDPVKVKPPSPEGSQGAGPEASPPNSSIPEPAPEEPVETKPEWSDPRGPVLPEPKPETGSGKPESPVTAPTQPVPVVIPDKVPSAQPPASHVPSQPTAEPGGGPTKIPGLESPIPGLTPQRREPLDPARNEPLRPHPSGQPKTIEKVKPQTDVPRPVEDRVGTPRSLPPSVPPTGGRPTLPVQPPPKATLPTEPLRRDPVPAPVAPPAAAPPPQTVVPAPAPLPAQPRRDGNGPATSMPARGGDPTALPGKPAASKPPLSVDGRGGISDRPAVPPKAQPPVGPPTTAKPALPVIPDVPARVGRGGDTLDVILVDRNFDSAIADKRITAQEVKNMVGAMTVLSPEAREEVKLRFEQSVSMLEPDARPLMQKFVAEQGAINGPAPVPRNAAGQPIVLNGGMRMVRRPDNIQVTFAKVGAIPSGTGKVGLTWKKNTEADLAGYRVYMGNAPGVFTHVYEVKGKQIDSFNMDDLPPGTYFWAITAFDQSNNESAFSNSVSKTIQ